MALFVLEKCLWPAKTRNNSNFLRYLHVFDLVLKYCSDIDKGNWLQLHSYFILLMGFFALVSRMSFFISVYQFLGSSNLVLHFYGNACIWIPKLIWSQVDWFWFFFLKYAFFHWLCTCMYWNLQSCLKLVSFLMTSSLFDNYFGGIPWSLL